MATSLLESTTVYSIVFVICPQRIVWKSILRLKGSLGQTIIIMEYSSSIRLHYYIKTTIIKSTFEQCQNQSAEGTV